jgi:hypothetical protein
MDRPVLDDSDVAANVEGGDNRNVSLAHRSAEEQIIETGDNQSGY